MNTRIFAFVTPILTAAVFLAACSDDKGKYGTQPRTAEAPKGHTSHSITVADGRSFVIPHEVVRTRKSSRRDVLFIDAEWAHQAFTREEAKAISQACVYENSRLRNETQDAGAQVPDPLRWLCVYAGDASQFTQ